MSESSPAGALKHIAAMAPYTLAQFDIPADKRLISLAQNESLRAPSPAVAQAVNNALADAALYPDPDWTALRAELSRLHGIDDAQILCGAGSMELIQCIAHAWLNNTSTVVTTQYAYAFINSVAQFTNAKITHVQESAFTVSVDRILEALDENTTMVFLANPGNPTGTRIPRADIRRLRHNMPEQTLLVVDEAYAEFPDHLDPPQFDLTGNSNTIVLRTFSKAYGLAGLRVGWGVFAPAVAGQVRKLLNPNNISVLSQAAAIACVKDQPYMQDTCRKTNALRDELVNGLRTVGIETPESHTNFVLIPFRNAQAADSVDSKMREHGMVMRNMQGYGLPECQRLTITNAEDMKQVQKVLLSAISEVQTNE